MKLTLRIFYLFVILFTSVTVHAQKAKLKRVSFKYFQPPLEPLDDDVQTYAVTTNTGLENKIELVGYKLVNQQNADVEFKLTSHSRLESKITDSSFKQEDGTTTKEWRYQVFAISDVDILVINRRNGEQKVVYSNNYVAKYVDKFSFPLPFSSYSEMKKSLNGRLIGAKKDILDDANQEIAKRFNIYINDHYAYKLEYDNFFVALGKGKKFDYSDLNEAFEMLKTVVEKVYKAELNIYSEEGIIDKKLIADNEIFKVTDENRDKLMNCITIWENAIKEYEPNVKKTRISDKNVDDLYGNIVFIHILLGEWDQAEEYLRKKYEIGKYVQDVEISDHFKFIKGMKKRYSLLGN